MIAHGEEMKFMVFKVVAALSMILSTISLQALDNIRYYSPDRIFSVLLPSDWKQTEKENRFAIESSNENVSVNGSAYQKEKSSLQNFANIRWDLIKNSLPFYKQIKTPYSFDLPGMKAVAAEYAGTWPGDKRLTYYFVVCAQSGDKYISLSFTMAPEEFSKNIQYYKTLSRSLQFEKEGSP